MYVIFVLAKTPIYFMCDVDDGSGAQFNPVFLSKTS